MIKIDETVQDLVSEEFKSLDEKSDYKLIKVESNGRPSMVYPGESVFGPLSIVSRAGKPCVLVRHAHNLCKYIRTSAIVEVIDKTDTTLTFRTEGGVYELEKLENQ